uniref:MICAL-like 2 n=2 Tax=Nothobranchius rachovii TaxID=451742 RepID=A0A1A8PC86_9TELE
MAAVKALQQWCRVQCQGYRDVSVTNMTTSFRDGLAFCALIHKHRPDLINFDSLRKEDVYENNKLAFSVAEGELGIPALLDAEDMVALKVPDRLSILTYVSQYYNYFHGRSPIGGMGGIKRPAEDPTNEPLGRGKQPVASKVFPASRPTRENSPPPSANIARPPPSPKRIRTSRQEVEKPNQTGTLSNKCTSCNGHVHLVQRHLVDGKLYHRNCAKLLTTNTSSTFWNSPRNTNASKFSPQPDPRKTSKVSPTPAPSQQVPTLVWSPEKPSSPSNSTITAPPSFPSASPPKQSPTRVVSKSTSPRDATFTSTVSISPTPTAAPRTSVAAAKTRESKLKFLQSDETSGKEEKKTTTFSTAVNKGLTVTGKRQEIPKVQPVTVVINVEDMDKGGGSAKTTSVGGRINSKQENNDTNKAKASVSGFITKKMAEENTNNNSKPSWTTVALKKTEKPQSQTETPRKEPEGVRGRVKLRADPSILSDLQPQKPAFSPRRLGERTPERGGLKPGKASPNTSGVSENESPADWRSKLKSVSKGTTPVGPPQSSHKPWTNGPSKTSELLVKPVHLSSLLPSPNTTPSPSKESHNFQKEQIRNGSKLESTTSKKKAGYIPREEIIRELGEIENNLNKVEKRGVELEVKLRQCEEEGADDSVMDELMDEWFNLIKNKQVAMRRESELVYIGKTQDLEEEQPNVEQELRRLMERPDHLKTTWDKKKEAQLMEKLLEIVNGRNAIIEGLDEDRLREEEEDEQLNDMMKSFNVKKDKGKKKSPVLKMFGWGGKKEAPDA